MNIRILHAPRDLFSKINATFNEEARADLVRQNIETYEQVLTVPFGDYTLDDFYRYTQNEDESWTNKFGFEGRYRSSSIGDVFVIDDKTFMVASCGFTELDGLVA